MKSAAQIPMPFDVKLMNFTAQLLVVLAACGLLASVLAWAVRRPAFDLRRVQVSGDVMHNDATTLRSSVLPHLSGNFFTVNLQAARGAFEAAPWVRQAVVQRVWPLSLKVTLKEHQPVAYWGADREGSRLLNSYGEVFEANAGDLDDEHLPVFDGPEGREAAGLQMLQMYRSLEPLLVPLDQRLDVLSLSSQGNWAMRLSGGARVEIGSGKPAEVIERVQRFADTVRTAMAPYGRRPLISADLRHPGGYAMQLEGVTTVEPKTSAPLVGKRRY